ncbi:hypothetical protein B0H19DRAFT_1084949 [Mycena capillaripes]|nr:hypothetical protein B0H19DRAFT_1084949 [Mycena capillaripes]
MFYTQDAGSKACGAGTARHKNRMFRLMIREKTRANAQDVCQPQPEWYTDQRKHDIKNKATVNENCPGINRQEQAQEQPRLNIGTKRYRFRGPAPINRFAHSSQTRRGRRSSETGGGHKGGWQSVKAAVAGKSDVRGADANELSWYLIPLVASSSGGERERAQNSESAESGGATEEGQRGAAERWGYGEETWTKKHKVDDGRRTVGGKRMERKERCIENLSHTILSLTRAAAVGQSGEEDAGLGWPAFRIMLASGASMRQGRLCLAPCSLAQPAMVPATWRTTREFTRHWYPMAAVPPSARVDVENAGHRLPDALPRQVQRQGVGE